jgi:hypothetical protein
MLVIEQQNWPEGQGQVLLGGVVQAGAGKHVHFPLKQLLLQQSLFPLQVPPLGVQGGGVVVVLVVVLVVVVGVTHWPLWQVWPEEQQVALL